MRFIYDNEWDKYDIDSYSSQDGNFPASNTQNTHSDVVWRATGDTSENIVIDGGSAGAITANSVAIINHNLSSGATIKFQMHTADAWGAPDVDETLTWRSGTIVKFFTSASKRWMRISIQDAANTDGYIELGRVFCGTYLQIDPSSRAEFSIENVRNDIVLDTDTNNAYGHTGVGYRQFEYNFPPTAYSMISNIRTVWDTVGRYKPFVMMNYDTRYTEIEPAYVRIVNNFTEEWRGHNKISYNLTLRETV